MTSSNKPATSWLTLSTINHQMDVVFVTGPAAPTVPVSPWAVVGSILMIGIFTFYYSRKRLA